MACEWDLTSAEKGSITSVVFVGMLLGAYIWGAIADNKGRKTGFLGTAVLTAIFGIASAMSPNYGVILI